MRIIPFGRSTAAVLVAVALGGCAGCSSTTATPSATGTVRLAVSSLPSVARGAPVRSAGCTSPSLPAVTEQRQDLTVDGTDRWYLLSTPTESAPNPTAASRSGRPGPGVPAARPLVLDFHGLAEGASLHATTSQFGVLGKRDGFVAAFPEGTGTPVQWNTTEQSGANPDLRFVSAMLDHLESTLCIDTSRVYASGFSDGAFMVSLLACTMSGRFAAIAAVSGLQFDVPCHTTRPVPILTFHGTADPILFFNGGIGVSTLKRLLGGGGASTGSTTTTTTRPVDLNGGGYPAAVRGWAAKDGCDPRSTDTRLSSQVILRSYRCPTGAGVAFYIVLGGGHAWPGSAVSRSLDSLTGFTTMQIDATDQIWRFFQRFRL